MVSKCRRQYDKDMREKFYVLNQELEQSCQLASAMTEREEASQPSTSKHKHTSFTQTQDTSCSRLSARVEYFEGSASASTEHQVLPVCDPQSFNDLDFNIMNGAHENYLEDTNIEPTRKWKRTAGVSHKRTENLDLWINFVQDYPLASWLPEWDAFILEMLRLEGRGDFISQATCHGTYGCSLPAEFHCEDCFGTELYCQSCTVDRHHEHPLHRIKVSRLNIFTKIIIEHLLALEGLIFSRCYTQISRTANSTGTPHPRALLQPSCLPGFHRTPREWHSWSQFRLLRVRDRSKSHHPAASHSMVPCNSPRAENCSNIQASSTFSHSLIRI